MILILILGDNNIVPTNTSSSVYIYQPCDCAIPQIAFVFVSLIAEDKYSGVFLYDEIRN